MLMSKPKNEEEFQIYLKEIRELAEGPFDEMQKEIEVTRKFPERFFELAKEHNLYRFYMPEEFGGWGMSTKEIFQVQEEFSRGPGGMRMHLHHAAGLNWRIARVGNASLPGQDAIHQLRVNRGGGWLRRRHQNLRRT